jgi:hypothetical protein
LPAAAGWIDVRVSIIPWPNFSVIMRTFSAMLANMDEKPYFLFRFYIFWRKLERIQKMRV